MKGVARIAVAMCATIGLVEYLGRAEMGLSLMQATTLGLVLVASLTFIIYDSAHPTHHRYPITMADADEILAEEEAKKAARKAARKEKQ